jgi:hypothetical protein
VPIGPITEKGHSMSLNKDALIELICKRCDFYKDSDKDLECGAYKILKGLLEKKAITPEDIQDVAWE